MSKIKTHISQAFWCTIENNYSTFKPASFSFGDDDSTRSISWFDELLEGGIELIEGDKTSEQSENNDSKEMPLTFLITGPPGSGKTTFALELCYRMAMHEDKYSLFISTESETERIIQNAKSFKYSQADLYIGAITENRPKNPTVTVWGKERFDKWKTIYDLVDRALKDAGNWLLGGQSATAEWLLGKIRLNDKTKNIDRFSPDILVIDSLNVIEEKERSDFFQKLLNTVYGGSGILICILDDASPDKQFSPWSHICDIVINLNYTHMIDYYLRTIEIVKARFQPHAWGKHQFKIYPKYTGLLADPISAGFKERDERIEYNRKLRRAHPYREEGGIFIYPSVHYYLSAYKRSAHKKKPEMITTRPINLNKVIKIPQGRCSAFFGCRGAHKSHLAFIHLIYRLHTKNESALIVSLRDDEEMTKQTLNKILWREFREKETLREEQRFQETPADLEKSLDDNMIFLEDFIDNGRLEILYFHPGYITPEEFFHRVFMSVQRLKQSGNQITVLFNSLDQLSARFPLCAQQQIFIPSIVTSLTGENITSIFIAVDEPGQPVELYGVLPLADLILSFYPHVFEGKDYFAHLNLKEKPPENLPKDFDALTKDIYDESYSERLERIETELKPTKLDAIVLQVVRYAGGRRAGARGLLELVHKEEISNSPYPEPGLHFSSLSANFSHGEPIGAHRFPRGRILKEPKN